MKTKIIRRIILSKVILLMLTPILSYGSVASEELTNWREHIIKEGNFAGAEYNSDAYRKLLKMGPNCLPDLFEVYRDEQNIHVLYYYTGLIRTIGRFDFFNYSKKPLKKNGYELEAKEDIPFLSMEIEENGYSTLPHDSYVLFKKNKLLQWWSKRETFLKRKKAITDMQKICGKTNGKYTKAKYRKFSKLHAYGIYNIPYYIDVIEEDNNAVIFCDFLRMAYQEEYRTIDPNSDMVENVRKVDLKYSTKQSKLDVISMWWNANGNSYTDLPALYKAIHIRIEKIKSKE